MESNEGRARPAAPVAEGRPAHPTRQAAILLIAVTLLIVVLAYLSASGNL